MKSGSSAIAVAVVVLAVGCTPTEPANLPPSLRIVAPIDGATITP